MPTKPKNLNQEVNSVNALNAIRNDIGGDYKAMVPEAYAAGDVVDGRPIGKEQALQRLRDIGETVTRYTAFTNSFLDQLINRIAYTLLSSRLYRNPWASFKRGYIELGETVEEVFVNLANAHQFDPETAEKEVFKRELPDVRAAFHTMNYQKFYKVSISRQELKTCFLSFEGLNNLVTKIIESLYTGANYDEFLMMKYLIAQNVLSGHVAAQTIPEATLQNADEIVSKLRVFSQDVQYMSTDYNFAGVTTYSDLSSQYLILSNEFSGVIDVGSLARAYNLDKAELLSRTVGVNNFSFTAPELKRLANLIYDDDTKEVFTAAQLTVLQSIQAMLVDKDWFMIFDNEDYMDAQKNAQGLYWNHFYHVWKTFSTSPFNTAVVFTTENISAAAPTLTLDPTELTAVPGYAYTIKATVTPGAGATIPNSKVVFATDAKNSTIDNRGVLMVGMNEEPGTFTVTATVDVPGGDPVTATCTVTVQAPAA